MLPLALTFPYVVFLAAVVLWSFIQEQGLVSRGTKATVTGDAPADRGSLYAIMVTQAFGFMAAFGAPWFSPMWGRLPDERVAFSIGIVLIVAAATLRRMCFRALGESFTGEVRVRAEQRVVTTGPYRWVRHPGYSAGILLTVGIGVAMGTWLGALLGGVFTAVGYAYRIRVEERALLNGLGDSYRDYMKRTKRFIPFVV
jgi:protein-S-isoprenylcysteine O-methyltransferase Ste14